MEPSTAAAAATSIRVALQPDIALRLDVLAAGGGSVLGADLIAGVRQAWGRGWAQGLLHLAATCPVAALAAPEAYWRDFAKLQLTRQLAQGATALSPADARRLSSDTPPLPGGEYLNSESLVLLWDELSRAVANWQASSASALPEILADLHPAWESVGKLCLSLAENPQDGDRPFALLATYTTRLSLLAKPQHAPLGRVLQELAGQGQTAGVARIGAALQAAAAVSPFVRGRLDDRRLLQPHALTSSEAHAFLRDAAALEECGVLVRVPAWWNKTHPPRVRVEVAVGEAPPKGVGAHALLGFSWRLSLRGVALTPEEWQALQTQTAGLVLVRGQWAEVDHQRLQAVLGSWQRLEGLVDEEGLSFAQALRLLHRLAQPKSAAADRGGDADSAAVEAWSEVRAGAWLAEHLRSLRARGTSVAVSPEWFQAKLRPYQQDGVDWLWQLHQLGLGACLADDMGLGKTIQILALFAALKQAANAAAAPQLIVAPATLVPNWAAEAAKFTPRLRVFVAHPSVTPAESLRQRPAAVDGADIVITTYGALLRYPWLLATTWTTAVLDEAQAIKNPAAQQTQAAKQLQAHQRIALTGTPVENSPLDLWSLFDWLSPGLLGTAPEFNRYLSERRAAGRGLAGLRELIQPYLLRRLKSDKRIIADLPPKTEMTVYCALSAPQAAIYQRLVDELKRDLAAAADGAARPRGKANQAGKDTADGKSSSGDKQRQGAVLSALLRLKQLCSHPSLVTGDGLFHVAASGKLQRLLVLCGEIAARQEKVLVFTQFRSMTEILAGHLTHLFGRPGCVLHGDTPINERQRLVQSFQAPGGDGPPFFVLSVKAGGTGLTLTAAAHVVHFDRWWNPAVEDQATDRAYRIGQRQPVMVHKFVCAGTVEAKIADLLASKRAVAGELLSGDQEVAWASLSDADLLALVALDLRQAELAGDGDE